MRGTRQLTSRSIMFAVATLAAAVMLVGPVSSATAVSPHELTSAQVSSVAKTKVVPNVVGKTAYVAKAALKKDGLRYSYSTPKGSVVIFSANWTVTKESPKAKSRVKAGTKIKLTVVKTASLSAAPATTTPAGPALTVAQRQAVIAARGYLSDGQGFSYLGLIDQLSSPDGNGFSVADATAAVNSVNADFNAQAVLAAKGYIASGIGFSHDSLVSQLESPDGNNFTPAQAQYAVTQIGL